KAIVNSPPLIYDQEPSMVAEDNEMSKDKEIDKLSELIRGMTLMMNLKIGNWKNIICTWHKFKSEHPKQSKSDNDTYPIEQDEHNVIIDSLDMSYDRERVDQDDDDDLANERDLLASLIEKLKCKIDDSKNRNKILETSNKALVDKLKDELEDFKTKNKSLESSNNHFKEANNELSKTNQLMFKVLEIINNYL
nr:hypothetical protein [Tanacetum cinerariifolium]